MKAVVIRDFDRSPVFELLDVPDPVPGTGEVLVRVEAAAMNFGDTIIMGGKYQVRPDLPFVAGSEGAGVVEAVGPGVTRLAVGDRVTAYGFVGDSRADRRLLGAFSEKMVAPASTFNRVPENMDMVTAAIFGASYDTAYYALVQRAAAKAGETLLVLGASGAAGTAAVEIGKALGLRVIASASTPDKQAAALAAGADVAITSGADDWRDQLQRIAPKGVDVVFDVVGGSSSELAFRSLARGGRHLVIGFASGPIPSLALNLALMKDAALIGVNNNRLQDEDPDLAAANRRALYDLYDEGLLRLPRTIRRFPLERFAEAYDVVSQSSGVGRLVICPTSN